MGFAGWLPVAAGSKREWIDNLMDGTQELSILTTIMHDRRYL